ncbi:DExH-box splicing factor binding site-domain-containing protein [Xylariales sp. AK1849]|nr:DExH-box splicing factor binding site-domain-containing protein [Xylariales sp. AK1849]
MPEPTTSQASRVAIRFGAQRPASSLGKRPRSNALNQDSDSEQESHGKHEAVTSFGAHGAENESRRRDAKAARVESKPLVIACHSNRNWRADTKGQQQGRKELLPHERENTFKGQDRETEPADQYKEVKWGLTVTKKAPADRSPATTKVQRDQGSELADQQGEESSGDDAPKNTEQEAMNALLGKDDSKKKKLVISGPTDMTEADALKRDYQAVGEVSTIAEYDQIPDGEFGLAMLRGMGFDGKSKGAKPKEVKRRPHLLGLGAKEDKEIKEAEIAQKHGHRERRPRLDEYRRDKEKERQQREERYSGSYRNEHERDRGGHGHSNRNDDRDRNRDRDRDRRQAQDQDSHRHRDRHSRH